MTAKRLNGRSGTNTDTQDERMEQMFEVLQLCCTTAPVKTTLKVLARLTASSKQFKDVVQCVVQQHVDQLLPAICKDCSAAEQHRQSLLQALAQAQWLCQLAGQQALTRHAAAVLSIPCIPVQLTQLILQAGMQPTTAQLVTAARARVEGLESWVVQPNFVQLGPLVQSIFKGSMDTATELLPAAWKSILITGQPETNLADALHLAVNLQDPAAAVAILNHAQQLRQQLVQHQLQALQQPVQGPGADQGGSEGVYDQQQVLANQAQQRLQEFYQQMNIAEVEQLLTTAVARMHSTVVQQLCDLPAAAYMPGDAVKQLIQRCLEHREPATAVLQRLLELALSASATAMPSCLIGKQPPAQQVESQQENKAVHQTQQQSGQLQQRLHTGTQPPSTAAAQEQQAEKLPSACHTSVEEMLGVAFTAGQHITLANPGGGEELLLQVQRFISRGGNADVYQVQLLQRLLIDDPGAVLAADKSLQLGQHYAVKVARSQDSYPAEDKQQGVSPTLFLRAADMFLKQEWRVLKDMSKCRFIINAYRFGNIAPVQAAEPAACHSNASHAAAAATTSSGEQQQQQGQVQPCTAAAVLPGILMEYASGGSVWEMVYMKHEKPAPLSLWEAWRVTNVALHALAALHEANYIHHDIKIDNMLCCEIHGLAIYKLTDMGSAHKLEGNDDRVPYKPLGTPQYWPPEMVQGMPHRFGYDIYGVGLLLLEMRTAQLPFRHLMKLPWEEQRLRRSFEELIKSGFCRLLMPSEQHLVEKCLQVDQVLRPQARELLREDTCPAYWKPPLVSPAAAS